MQCACVCAHGNPPSLSLSTPIPLFRPISPYTRTYLRPHERVGVRDQQQRVRRRRVPRVGGDLAGPVLLLPRLRRLIFLHVCVISINGGRRCIPFRFFASHSASYRLPQSTHAHAHKNKKLTHLRRVQPQQQRPQLQQLGLGLAAGNEDVAGTAGRRAASAFFRKVKACVRVRERVCVWKGKGHGACVLSGGRERAVRMYEYAHGRSCPSQ